MRTPAEFFETWKAKWKKEYTTAFLTVVCLGLLVHLPVMVSDIPNHDGLDSLYFDQNMITSGRWFLTVACGISSFYNLPWLIGVLGLIYLGLASVCLVELFEIKSRLAIGVISGLLVSFPAMASTFAYVYTLDGYMLALLLAIGSVLVTKKYRYGFLAGMVLLGCSMGIYQAYLPVCLLCCLYVALQLLAGQKSAKEKRNGILRLLGMGIGAAVFYFAMLYVLLLLQGKQLSDYQGINGGGALSGGLLSALKGVYRDFFAFTIKGGVLCNNLASAAALILLALGVAAAFVCFVRKEGLWKKPLFYGLVVLVLLIVPIAVNYILIVSGNLNYHLIMRYHWVFLLILAVVFLERQGKKPGQWVVLVCGVTLIFNFAVTDNIGYSNLEKKYEKTYAYCVRLLDRIENTPGYYQGIPIAMIGVVGDEAFPETNLTGKVTDGMVGLGGDWLLYTGENYRLFMKHYLGATLNILDTSCMDTIYYSEAYQDMDSFPGPNSTKIVDGILYVHTENIDRTLSFEE